VADDAARRWQSEGAHATDAHLNNVADDAARRWQSEGAHATDAHLNNVAPDAVRRCQSEGVRLSAAQLKKVADIAARRSQSEDAQAAAAQLGNVAAACLATRSAATSISAVHATLVSGQGRALDLAPAHTEASTPRNADAPLVCAPACPLAAGEASMQRPAHLHGSAPPATYPSSPAEALDRRKVSLREPVGDHLTLRHPAAGTNFPTRPALEADVDAAGMRASAANAMPSAVQNYVQPITSPSAGFTVREPATMSSGAHLMSVTQAATPDASNKACGTHTIAVQLTLAPASEACGPAATSTVLSTATPANQSGTIPGTTKPYTPAAVLGSTSGPSDAQFSRPHNELPEGTGGHTATQSLGSKAGSQSRRPALHQGALSSSQRTDHSPTTQSSLASLSKRLEAFVQPAVARVLRSKCVVHLSAGALHVCLVWNLFQAAVCV
jgi:hypothetical protein